MGKRTYVPPERITVRDVFQILVGILSLAFGIIILVRTLPYGVYLPAIVGGASFLGFGVYRLWMAWVGWQLYQAAKRGKRS